jgi:hypothetical protein
MPVILAGRARAIVAAPSARVAARPRQVAQPMKCGEVPRGAPVGMGGCARQGVRGGGSLTRPNIDGVAEPGLGGGVHQRR